MKWGVRKTNATRRTKSGDKAATKRLLKKHGRKPLLTRDDYIEAGWNALTGLLVGAMAVSVVTAYELGK